MKTRELVCVSDIAFSHRPHAGISIGVANIGGVAYIAGTFLRDGDEFNRPLARKIIVDRLSSDIFRGKSVNFVYAIERVDENIDGRTIMSALRAKFKPDPNETDAEFSHLGNFDGVEVRSAMARDEAWKKICGMFEYTIRDLTAKI